LFHHSIFRQSNGLRLPIRATSIYGYRYDSLLKIVLLALLVMPIPLISQQHDSEGSYSSVTVLAEQCAGEVVTAFEGAMIRADLTQQDIFDRMYAPVPGVYPKKYHTSYDSWADIHIPTILNNALSQHQSLLYIYLIDHNGYIPVEPVFRDLRLKPPHIINKGFIETGNHLPETAYQKPASDKKHPGEFREISVPVKVDHRPWGQLIIGYVDRK